MKKIAPYKSIHGTGLAPENDGASSAVRRLNSLLQTELELLELDETSAIGGACRLLFATSGKLTRGRLLLVAASEMSPDNAAKVDAAACAVELLHLGSLAHDDVIDRGEIRRGRPTAAVQFGAPAASFAGSMVFCRAVELMAQCGSTALDRFSSTVVAMCEGGLNELNSVGDIERSEAQYLEVAAMKTASAIASAGWIGATLAGCPSKTIQRFDEFGLNLGMAWQIWDDLLDLQPSAEVEGKSTGRDLATGVITLPVIFALEANEELRARLSERLVSRDEVEKCEALVRETDAITRCAAKADRHFSKAITIAKSLPQGSSLQAIADEIRIQHSAFLT